MYTQTVDEMRVEALERMFAAPSPQPEDAKRIAAINEAGKAFAKVVIENVPWSVDRDHAVQVIREGAMLAREALLVRESVGRASEEITTASGHKIRVLENSAELGREIITILEGKSP